MSITLLFLPMNLFFIINFCCSAQCSVLFAVLTQHRILIICTHFISYFQACIFEPYFFNTCFIFRNKRCATLTYCRIFFPGLYTFILASALYTFFENCKKNIRNHVHMRIRTYIIDINSRKYGIGYDKNHEFGKQKNCPNFSAK